MTTYNIAGKTYNAVPLTEFQLAKVSLSLNAPNSLTFSNPCKFDATSISNLQKDVSINYATKTLFTGKTKEIQQNLGAGDEHQEYSVIGANLEETYTAQISGDIRPNGLVIWTSEDFISSGHWAEIEQVAITGNVFANSDITFNPLITGYILGNAYAVGNINMGNISVFSIHNNYTPYPLPNLDFTWYENHVDPAWKFNTSKSWSYANLNPPGGIIYVDGNVNLVLCTITGCIVATGYIYVDNCQQTQVTNLPAFACQGYLQIFVSTTDTYIQGLLYSQNDKIELDGELGTDKTITIHGALLGNRIENWIGLKKLTLIYSNYSTVPGLTF